MTMNVKALVIWGWWGWWYNTWAWGGAWWYQYSSSFTIIAQAYSVTVATAGAKWTAGVRWGNWWDSIFSTITSKWWWGWWFAISETISLALI